MNSKEPENLKLHCHSGLDPESSQFLNFLHIFNPKSIRNQFAINSKGVTLVELIISMGISSMIMLGMSVFFSSTMHNMLESQKESDRGQDQFIGNQILQSKFLDMEGLVDIGEIVTDYPYSIIQNTASSSQLPFTMVAMIEDTSINKFVMKDFLFFNEVEDNIVSNMWSGSIYDDAGTPNEIPNLRMPYGFDDDGGNWHYIAFPHETNKIQRCDWSNPTALCIDVPTSSVTLSMPIDIEIDINLVQNLFFVSDYAQNKVVMYDFDSTTFVLSNPREIIINKPVGLEYDSANDMLFVSEVENNSIQKINLSTAHPYTRTTIIGGASAHNKECDGISAKYCKLNYPTDLYYDDTAKELYIADSGNNRILKINDPGKPGNESKQIKFKTTKLAAIEKIEFTFPVEAVVSGGTGYAISSVPAGFNTTVNKVNGIDPNVFEQQMWTTTSESTYLTNKDNCDVNNCLDPLTDTCNTNTGYCVNDSAKQCCATSTPDEIKVNENGFFENGDIIKIENEVGNFTINTKNSSVLTLDRNLTVDAGDQGQKVNLMNITPSGTEITFEFHDINFSNPAIASGFQEITTKIYYHGGLFDEFIDIVRIGDGKIGTDEDTVEVFAYNSSGNVIINTSPAKTVNNTSLQFPTGVSNDYIFNTGNKELITISTGGSVPIPDDFDDIAKFPTTPTYDYESAYELNTLSINDITNNNLLQIEIDAWIDKDDGKSQINILNVKY